MKIESIAVRHEEAGNLVTLSFRIPGESDIVDSVSGILTMLDLLKNDREAVERAADDVLKAVAEKQLAPEYAYADPEPPPEQPTRRRRRGNPLETQEAPAAPEENPTARSADTTQPDTSATTTAAPAGDTSEATPTRRRRRSQSAATAETQSTTPASPAPATQPSADDISDADLTKAASLGAQALTPKAVMEYLHGSFGVRTVNELKGEQRRQFLDGIKAQMEAVS